MTPSWENPPAGQPRGHQKGSDSTTQSTRYQGPNGTVWEPSAWCRDLLATIVRRVDAGRLRRCPHQSTSPLYWLTWQPHQILCHACADTEGQSLKHTAGDWTCDRCATTNPNDCAPFSVPVPTKRHGLIIARFGLCDTCKAGELP